MITRTVPDSIIIPTFFWPYSRTRIGWLLNVSSRRVDDAWRRAKQNGDLPNITRPPGGFDLRKLSMKAAA